MNYAFSTGAERIAVIEDLRKPGTFFPPGWDPHRTRQRESLLRVSSFSFKWLIVLSVITWLLQHRPEDRPTALELSQSPLLPQRVEDEYFKGALKLMSAFSLPVFLWETHLIESSWQPKPTLRISKPSSHPFSASPHVRVVASFTILRPTCLSMQP